MRTPKALRAGKACFIITVAILLTFTILNIQQVDVGTIQASQLKSTNQEQFQPFNLTESQHGKWRGLTEENMKGFSKLGRILFLDEKYPEINSSKTYKILLWKYGNTIHDRHIRRYTKEEHDPFEFCSVKNCEVSYKDEDYPTADIVILHLHRTKGVKDLPPPEKRREDQIWAFSTDESPYHTFLGGGQKFASYNGIFNWSMTFRMDADIPVPYGRTALKDKFNESTFNVYSWLLTKKHDVIVAIMGSNCGSQNHRWEYLRELQKHIPVDTYGACGTLKCAGHFNKDCPDIGRYMFYLSFENSNCDEYITEKLWWNAYSKNSIPIVMGSSQKSYAKIAPPHSYINVDDFASPRDLATYLQYLVNTPAELQRFFQWKKYFDVLNEHGYFQSVSYHYCRVCEALNFNSREKKVYNNMDEYWSVARNCHPSWDA